MLKRGQEKNIYLSASFRFIWQPDGCQPWSKRNITVSNMKSQVYDTQVARLLKTDEFIAQESLRSIPAKVIRWNAPVGVLHSLMPKGRLRVGNSLWKSHVRVENYSPLGVVSHTNQQILGTDSGLVGLVSSNRLHWRIQGGGATRPWPPIAKEGGIIKLPIFLEREFGSIPKNSGLNRWSFQFWGTPGWDPAPGCPPPKDGRLNPPLTVGMDADWERSFSKISHWGNRTSQQLCLLQRNV